VTVEAVPDDKTGFGVEHVVIYTPHNCVKLASVDSIRSSEEHGSKLKAWCTRDSAMCHQSNPWEVNTCHCGVSDRHATNLSCLQNVTKRCEGERKGEEGKQETERHMPTDHDLCFLQQHTVPSSRSRVAVLSTTLISELV
jgi:hypothetical protein